MKALVLTPSTATAAVHDIPRPVPGPGEVLIRVQAVAINPVDHIYFEDSIATQDQRVLGVDFAGEVVGRNQIWRASLTGEPRKPPAWPALSKEVCSVPPTTQCPSSSPNRDI